MENGVVCMCVGAEAVFSFLTTRPLSAAEWTVAKYSPEPGQWHATAGVSMCSACESRQVVVGFVAEEIVSHS